MRRFPCAWRSPSEIRKQPKELSITCVGLSSCHPPTNAILISNLARDFRYPIIVYFPCTHYQKMLSPVLVSSSRGLRRRLPRNLFRPPFTTKNPQFRESPELFPAKLGATVYVG